MLRPLQDLLDAFTLSFGDPSPQERASAQQLATAVLLVEVMRADPASATAGRQAVLAALRRRFALADPALEQLLALATAESQHLYDYYHFTSTLNEQLTQEQKIALVEALWSVAYADLRLEEHETHAINKIAGLLHVTHGEYIGAKMRAKEAAGLA